MTSPIPSAIDATTLTMSWNKLISIVDEAQVALLRTAFSRIVTEAWDFSCALFDARGEMIAQGRHGLPAFLGCMAQAMQDFLAFYPPETLQPGDAVMTTDPWIGASQINDVFLVSPIFHKERIVAYAMSVSHSPDVGGRLLSADSREIFEEGFRLPIIKLFSAGEPNEDLFRIIRLNVRVPEIVVGDLMAQLAANTTMTRRMVDFLEKRGLDDADALFAEVWRRSDQAMRQAISTIPQGTYRASIETDGFDNPVTLTCTVSVAADEIHVDCTGTSGQQEFGINCTKRWSFAEIAHACICVARPAVPVNGAMLKRIRYTVPEGAVINASYPAALGARALVAMYLQDLIFKALGEAVPQRIIAESGTPPHLTSFLGTGNSGRRYIDAMFLNGGVGARPTMDGLSSIGWPANVSGIAVEITENEKPLIFLRKELVTDSGGAGRQRGGLTAELSIHSQSAEPITMGVRLDRVQHPAQGFAGGAAGTPASVCVNGKAVHPKKTLHLKRGEVYTVRCAGGGGYGKPTERDPEAVLRDVQGGYVSPSVARDAYGVVLSPDGTSVMAAETDALRERMGDR